MQQNPIQENSDAPSRDQRGGGKIRRAIIKWVVLIFFVEAFFVPLLIRVTQPLISWAYDAPGTVLAFLIDVLYRDVARWRADWLILGVIQAIFIGIVIFVFLGFIRGRFDIDPGGSLLTSVWGRVYTGISIAILSVTLLLVPAMEMELGINFDLAITAIAPYVPAQEVLQLRSEWVRMQGRPDYIKISKRMEFLADSAHIAVPSIWHF